MCLLRGRGNREQETADCVRQLNRFCSRRPFLLVWRQPFPAESGGHRCTSCARGGESARESGTDRLWLALASKNPTRPKFVTFVARACARLQEPRAFARPSRMRMGHWVRDSFSDSRERKEYRMRRHLSQTMRIATARESSTRRTDLSLSLPPCSPSRRRLAT